MSVVHLIFGISLPVIKTPIPDQPGQHDYDLTYVDLIISKFWSHLTCIEANGKTIPETSYTFKMYGNTAFIELGRISTFSKGMIGIIPPSPEEISQFLLFLKKNNLGDGYGQYLICS